MSQQNKITPKGKVTALATTKGLTVAEQEHMDKLIHLFYVHCIGTRGYGQATASNYKQILIAAVRNIVKPAWQWGLPDIDAYLAYLALERNNAASTQNMIITVLRTFQNWLLSDVGLCNQTLQLFGVRPAEYINEENAIAYKRKARQRKEVRVPLTSEEVKKLLAEYDFAIQVAASERLKSFKTLQRDKVITYVGLLTGLRAAELISLTIHSFMPDVRYPEFGNWAILRVIGKGRKERAVRLYNPQIKSIMEWYMVSVRPKFMSQKTTDTNLLFYSERGGELVMRQYRRSLADMAAKAGISKNITPHILRHTYATLMLNTIGPEALQKQLGHKFLSTTLGTYYYQPAEETGQEVYLGINKLTSQLNSLAGVGKDKD